MWCLEGNRIPPRKNEKRECGQCERGKTRSKEEGEERESKGINERRSRDIVKER